MGRFYGTKILNGFITIDDVPWLWKSATQDWLLNNQKNGTNSAIM